MVGKSQILNFKILYLGQIGLLVVGADQLIKWLLANLGAELVRPNYGVGFGFFPDFGLAVHLLGLILFGFYLIKFGLSLNNFEILALGLLLGGGISNLVDRLRFGFVVDFVSPFGFLPAVNLADLAVVFGLAVIIVYWFKSRLKSSK